MAEYDMEDAIEKAKEFLEEHHSTINLKFNLKSSKIEAGIWYIVFDAGFSSEQLKEVKINANSGKVIGYTDVDIDDEDDD